MDRASDSGSEGWGFESLLGVPKEAGTNPCFFPFVLLFFRASDNAAKNSSLWLEFLERDSPSRTCHRHVLCATTSGVPKEARTKPRFFSFVLLFFRNWNNAAKILRYGSRIFLGRMPQSDMPPACPLCGYFWRTNGVQNEHCGGRNIYGWPSVRFDFIHSGYDDKKAAAVGDSRGSGLYNEIRYFVSKC